MADLERRLDFVRREAMNARIMTENQAAIVLVATAAIAALLVGLLSDGLGLAVEAILVLVPTIIVGLVLLLAHRLGLAYALIRRMAGSDDP